MGGMLSGVMVIDLTRHLAGPFCTMNLSDMGADVIKVEPPNGDDSRTVGPFLNGESGYFMSVNRGKRGITLDLKSEEGKEILRRLIRKSDVLVESFRPGVMERLGFSYADTSKINQKIIYASVSGFGQYGPYRYKGAYDMIIQGYGGIFSITGSNEDALARVGYSIGDLVASMYTAIGILGSLHARHESGKGRYIDISMLDCQVSFLENAIIRYTATEEIPKPLGTRHPSLAPFQSFQAKNGYFLICAPHDKQFKSLCKTLGIEDLAEDERFCSNNLRVTNIDVLTDILNEIFKDESREHWIQILEKAGVPAGPINNIKEVVECPQVGAREMIVEVDHPVAGKIKIAGSPVKTSADSPRVQGPAPVLGQDNEAILETLGYSKDDIRSLREKKII